MLYSRIERKSHSSLSVPDSAQSFGTTDQPFQNSGSGNACPPFPSRNILQSLNQILNSFLFSKPTPPLSISFSLHSMLLSLPLLAILALPCLYTKDLDFLTRQRQRKRQAWASQNTFHTQYGSSSLFSHAPGADPRSHVQRNVSLVYLCVTACHGKRHVLYRVIFRV